MPDIQVNIADMKLKDPNDTDEPKQLTMELLGFNSEEVEAQDILESEPWETFFPSRVSELGKRIVRAQWEGVKFGKSPVALAEITTENLEAGRLRALKKTLEEENGTPCALLELESDKKYNISGFASGELKIQLSGSWAVDDGYYNSYTYNIDGGSFTIGGEPHGAQMGEFAELTEYFSGSTYDIVRHFENSPASEGGSKGLEVKITDPLCVLIGADKKRVFGMCFEEGKLLLLLEDGGSVSEA